MFSGEFMLNLSHSVLNDWRGLCVNGRICCVINRFDAGSSTSGSRSQVQDMVLMEGKRGWEPPVQTRRSSSGGERKIFAHGGGRVLQISQIHAGKFSMSSSNFPKKKVKLAKLIESALGWNN